MRVEMDRQTYRTREGVLDDILDQLMSLDSHPGDPVVYTYPGNGSEDDRGRAESWLKLGGVYTITCIFFSPGYSCVEFREVPCVWFNCVQFADAPKEMLL